MTQNADGVYRIDVVTTADGVDTGVNAAKSSLKSLDDVAVKAGDSVDKIGDGATSAAQKIDRNAKSIIASIQRTTAVAEAGERGTSKYYEAIANQRGVSVETLRPYLSQLDSAIEKQKAASGSLNNLGVSAGQTAAALRNVPAQFTDIVVSLQSGQAPMTVLLQQGGQLKDMFGGVGNAAKALGGYVMSLVNPYTVAAAAVGALATAFHAGATEAEGMAKALVLSGNAASTSVNQLTAISESVSKATGATKGAVVSALESIVNAGGVTAGNLERVSTATIKMSKATGESVDDIVKKFSDLAKDPVKASETLNEKYNYLTASVYKQIKALEDQGKATEAAALAQKEFADTLSSRSDEMIGNVGNLEKAWNGVKGAIVGAWDAAKGIGRVGSLEARRDTALEGLRDGKSGSLAEFSVLQAQIDAQEKMTAEKQKQTTATRASIELEKMTADFADKGAKKQIDLNKAHEAYRLAVAGVAGDTKAITEESKKYEKVIAGINEKYKETGKSQIVKDAEALDTLIDRINGKQSGLDAGYWKDLERLNNEFKKRNLTESEYVVLVETLTKNQKFYKDGIKSEADALKERNKWLEEWNKEQKAETKDIAGKVEAAQAYLDNLGLTKSAQEELAASKLEIAAAAKEEYAANLENAAAYAGEFTDAYHSASEAAKEQANALRDLAQIKRSTSAKEIAVEQAKDSAREWSKFADDIERSLTDSLYRSFESGKSFGESFADSLENTFKTIALKFAVNYVINGAGQLVGSLGNSAINAVLGTGSSNGGAGVNWLGAANNLSTANSLYGALAGLTGTQLGASSASLLYANGVGMAGGDSLGALIAANGSWSGVSTGAAAGSSTAGGSAAGGTGAAGGVATVAWVAAIIAGMWMSSEAWKAGIRWENYAKQKDVQLWDAEVSIRKMHDEPARAIFGDSFVDSQFYAIAGGGSLSAQIHYAIQKALFGTKYSTGTQLDGTFSESAQGFDGRYGINMKKTNGGASWISKAVFGGGGGGSREWTDWFALPTEADNIMDTLYRGVRNSFIMLGETFDDTSLASKITGFSYRFNIASTDMASVVNAASAGLQEAMGNVLTPSISLLKKQGETWANAFERILLETNAVSRAFDLMGDTMSGVFGANNLDGILKASDSFVALFGSIDIFNASFQSYYSNYYTSSEQISQAWEDMAAKFKDIGQVMPTTRQGFRDLVESLDLSKESGREAFASLMGVQAAFAQLVPTLDDVANSAKALREAQAGQIGTYVTYLRNEQKAAQENSLKEQQSAAQNAAYAASALADAFKTIKESLTSYRSSLLAGESITSPAEQLAAARKAFNETSSKAKLGDVTAATNLQSVSENLLSVSRAYGTSDSYARDLGMVVANVDSVIGVAERQIPIAEQQLTVAESQLATLKAMLDALSSGVAPVVVNDYQKAAKDWQAYFSSTAVGEVTKYAFGTMQRISDSVGLFIDNAGKAFTFGADGPYALASASSAWREEMIKRYGQYSVPAFASGGYHAGGLRLVGENGPELEITGPSGIVNSSGTSSVIESFSEMVDELKSLREEVSALREEQKIGNAVLASNTSSAAKVLEKFDYDGMPEVRAA